MSQPPNTTLSRSTSGTVSLIFGERPSVRLPKADRAHLRERSNGVGQTLANGENAGNRRRADGAKTDEQNAQFALCRSDFRVFHSRQLYHYARWESCFRQRGRKRSTCAGDRDDRRRLGDRLLNVGCTDASLLGAMSAKVGLSGRACAIVPDETQAARARRGAEKGRRAARDRNRTARQVSLRGWRVQPDRRRQSGQGCCRACGPSARRDAAAGAPDARAARPDRRHRARRRAAGSARCSVRRHRRQPIRTTHRLAGPSPRSRPKASARPGNSPSGTGCPSSKAYVSGDTPANNPHFSNNSRRQVPARDLPCQVGRHIPKWR